MANPAAQVKVKTIDHKPALARPAISESTSDGSSELGRNLFIRIEAQNPRLGALAQSNILLSNVPLPGVNLEQRAEFRCDLARSISGTGIHHNDFGDQIAHAFETARQIVRFIEGDHGRRQGQSVAHGPTDTLFYLAISTADNSCEPRV